MADGMSDDAVHVSAPWEPRKSLCGQHARRNLIPLTRFPPADISPGAECWSCWDAAKWIIDAIDSIQSPIPPMPESDNRQATR